MKEKNIHKIIDLYFEAQLSRSEEDDLFRTLLAFEGQDNKVKEALAVMLMSRNDEILASECKSPVRQASVENRFLSFRPLKWAAAVAVIAITCVTALLYTSHFHHGNNTERMMAYVGGVKVNDHSEIMKIVDDQLNDISMSSEFFSQTIATDLDDIRNAFNEEGI